MLLHPHSPAARRRYSSNDLVAAVDQVLLPGGTFQLLPTAELRQRVPWQQLRFWAFQRGRYTVPTRELVTLVRGIIGERSAIEIGAGSGSREG